MDNAIKKNNLKAYEYVQSVKHKLLHDNRFFVDNKFLYYLDLVIEHSTTFINAGEIFYRARIYKEKDVYEKWRDGIALSDKFKGYSEKESGANPNPQKAGRANPKWISYLYAATDVDTAVLEVCNKRNTPVSVAEVKIIKKMKVLNLAEDVHIGGGEVHSKEELDELVFAFDVGCEIASEMNRTFYNDEDYLLTQFICEYVKNKGIDCILYQSTSHTGNELEPREELSAGNNVVVFNKDAYKIISSNLYLVRNISIRKDQFMTKEK